MSLFGFDSLKEAEGRQLTSLCIRHTDAILHHHNSTRHMVDGAPRSPKAMAPKRADSCVEPMVSPAVGGRRPSVAGVSFDRDDEDLDPLVRAILLHSKDKGDYEIKVLKNKHTQSNMHPNRAPDSPCVYVLLVWYVSDAESGWAGVVVPGSYQPHDHALHQPHTRQLRGGQWLHPHARRHHASQGGTRAAEVGTAQHDPHTATVLGPHEAWPAVWCGVCSQIFELGSEPMIMLSETGVIEDYNLVRSTCTCTGRLHPFYDPCHSGIQSHEGDGMY